MNTLTIVLVMLAIIVMLAAVVWVEFKQIKKLNERKKSLEASYREAQRNISYLVKHQKEIAEIKTASGEKLEEIAEAKTDEEIFEIVNSVIAPTHSRM
jgi:type II secretory pathway pseudopilin PulG